MDLRNAARFDEQGSTYLLYNVETANISKKIKHENTQNVFQAVIKKLLEVNSFPIKQPGHRASIATSIAS